MLWLTRQTIAFRSPWVHFGKKKKQASIARIKASTSSSTYKYISVYIFVHSIYLYIKGNFRYLPSLLRNWLWKSPYSPKNELRSRKQTSVLAENNQDQDIEEDSYSEPNSTPVHITSGWGRLQPLMKGPRPGLGSNER